MFNLPSIIQFDIIIESEIALSLIRELSPMLVFFPIRVFFSITQFFPIITGPTIFAPLLIIVPSPTITLPSWRNELEIADALQILIEEKKEIVYEIITDFWKDTGTPDDIIEANKFLLEKIQESENKFQLLQDWMRVFLAFQ